VVEAPPLSCRGPLTTGANCAAANLPAILAALRPARIDHLPFQFNRGIVAVLMEGSHSSNGGA